MRGAVSGCADKGLNLNQKRTDAFDSNADRDAGKIIGVVRDEHFGRIGDLAQALPAHFVYTEFGRAAEAVLGGAEYAVKILVVAFELQDGVDNVLEDLWPGQRTFFGDVSDQKDGNSGGLGVLKQSGGTFTDLTDTSGSRFKSVGRNGLYGVDNDNAGCQFLDMRKYVL